MDWTILISVVLGVITGIVANLMTKVLDSMGIPWYLNKVYQGVRIDGSWHVSQSAMASDNKGFSTDWRLSLSLVQSAQKIHGIATATSETESGTEVINYSVSGMIRDRFVQISLHPADASKLAFSSFLIEVTGDGGRMVGYRIFYGLKRQEIRSVAVTLDRASIRQGII